MDIEKVRGLCSEIFPASSHDAYLPIGIKAEVISDEEEEEYSVLITIPRIEPKPEVNCLLGGFHKYMYPLSHELRYSKQLTFMSFIFFQ